MQSKHIKSAKAIKTATLFLLFHLLPASGTAQVSSTSPPFTGIEISNDSISNVVRVRYSSNKEINSFLVLITDSKGNTLFLENNHRFTGIYLRHIDLSKSPKGEFQVNIICDEDKMSKKIIVP